MHEALRFARCRHPGATTQSRVAVVAAGDKGNALRDEPHVGKRRSHRADVIQTGGKRMHTTDIQRTPAWFETVVGIERGRTDQRAHRLIANGSRHHARADRGAGSA